ncbi:MAG: diacylglycerol kinase family lipid kinase [Sphingobacteriales bacterium]|nr:MAG: diacylglycerol kinase family lipid kinase [Sphingobacteriales bacterium]
MTTPDNPAKILFVINSKSGKNDTDWEQLINDHFKESSIAIQLLQLEENCDPGVINDAINSFAPDRVVAVGGDGTVKLVAEQILDKPGISLGILPGGSANGMAKELGIPVNAADALKVCEEGVSKKIHLVKVNDHICIHLSDVGFNAFVIKMFEKLDSRGMWGYVKASWKALWQHDKLNVKISTDEGVVQRSASMIVIANATKYGSGALINPEGKLDDNLFEVIVVRKISFAEIFKMMVTHMAYDPSKTEVFQCTYLDIVSKRHAHFQVDGEYLGKTNKVNAALVPAAISIIVPK